MEVDQALENIRKARADFEDKYARKIQFEKNNRLPALQKIGIARGKCMRLANKGLPTYEAKLELEKAEADYNQVMAELGDLERETELASRKLEDARHYLINITASTYP